MKRLSQFLFGTLRGRLILGVALVHAVLMLLFIADLSVRQRTLILGHQLGEATAFSQILATSAAGWIAADDIAGLQELADAQRRYPDILFALLTDKDGYVLASTDQSRQGLYLLDLPPKAQQTVISRTLELIDVATPALIGGRHVGWARVGIGQKEVARNLAEITRDGILYAFAAILIGSIIAWLLGRQVTARLYAVQSTITAVRSGDRSARSALAGSDEAATMAREFNGMLDAVAQGDADLQVSEARLAVAQRIARLGNWEWDILENRLWWSAETYRLFNLSSGEFGANFESFLNAVHPEDRERVQGSIAEALKAGSGEWQIDYRIVLSTGAIRYVHEEGMTLFASDGQPLKRIGTVQDITERKKNEEILSRINEQLEERVQERTVELAAMNEDLARMNKVFVGRELKMVEMKEKIKALEQALSSSEKLGGGEV